jgi:hypothetical protein
MLRSPLENEPNAHSGYKESDDAGGRIDAIRANPPKDLRSVSQAEIGYNHGRKDGDGNGEKGDKFKLGMLDQRDHAQRRRDSAGAWFTEGFDMLDLKEAKALC